MATINPSFGPVGGTPIQAPAPRTRSEAETIQAPLGDGLNIDFSKASAAVVEEKAVAPQPLPQLEVTVESLVAPSLGGVQAAAADGGFTLSSTGGMACLETVPLSALIGESPSIDGCLAKLAGPGELKTITAASVNWDQGANVVSNAQKFVIPVPQFADGGEPLVYPAGAKDKDGAELGGTPIKDWQGQPIGDKGVVFFNAKDQAWQAVKSDGQGVVIMNQMTEDQGKALMQKIGGDPGKLTLEQFKDVLTYASSDEVGCRDMYNSDRGFISKKMNAMETSATGIPQYGLFRRDDRDVCKALFAEGPGEFEAPTSGGVMVKQPIPEEGGILCRQPDGQVFLYRKIDLDVFVDTYTIKDGSKVVLDDLPRHQA